MKFFGHDLPSPLHVVRRLNDYIDLLPEEVDISKSFLMIDYARSFIVYGCGVMDYFLYGFYDLNRHGKKKFVTVKQRVLYDYKHNTNEGVEIVLDKEKALMHFSRFITRDWCGQKYHNSIQEYQEFEGKHDKAIVKPLKELGGNHVQIVDIKKILSSDDSLYNYCSKRNFIVEEIIVQHEKMNLMYAECVNTIRVVTVDGKVIGVSLRIGTGGNTIDNAHAGGIFAEVDKESGIVISKGMNYRMESFIRHPNTNTIIPGFEIPYWDETKELIASASKIIPQVSLIGWDIAISTNGPTIVEVNHMPGLELIQAPNRHGIRSSINMGKFK